jgi:hypothetical protein
VSAVLVTWALLAIVPGTGHGLLMEKPDLCNWIIIDFLTEPVEETGGGR